MSQDKSLNKQFWKPKLPFKMSTDSKLTIMLNRTDGRGSVQIPTERTAMQELRPGQNIKFEVKEDLGGRNTDFSASRYEGDQLLQSISGSIGAGSWINAYLNEGDPHHITPDGHATFQMTADGLQYVGGATGHPLGDEAYYSAVKEAEADRLEADLRSAVEKVKDSIFSRVPRKEDGGNNDASVRTYIVPTIRGDIQVDVDDDGALTAKFVTVDFFLSGQGILRLSDTA